MVKLKFYQKHSYTNKFSHLQVFGCKINSLNINMLKISKLKTY